MNNIVTGTSDVDLMHIFRDMEIDELSASPSAIRPGLRVSKRGRATSWTDGYVNGIQADLSLITGTKNDGERRRKPINPYGYGTINGRRVVTVWVAHTPPEEGARFCSAGDEGALIFGRLGEIVGLLIGPMSPRGMGTLFRPMRWSRTFRGSRAGGW